MAGPASEITHQSLEQILRQKLELPTHRAAAAALTVAFQICKDGHLTRGENVSDETIREQITKLYHDFIIVTDPQLSVQASAQHKG